MKKVVLRVSIAQINFIVGDLEGNAVKIKKYISQAQEIDSDIVCFPELALTGYPPEDLLIKPKFIQDNIDLLKDIVKSTKDITAIVGFVDRDSKGIYNAAAVIYNGRIKGIYRKIHLPNYGVFDEVRYFKPGNQAEVFNYKGIIFGVNICEDIWHLGGPAASQAKRGAKLIININSSPFHAGKVKQRENIISKQAKDNKVGIVYANLIGAQDELVFDGQSMAVDQQGKIIGRAEAFKEQLFSLDLELQVPKPKNKSGIINISHGLIKKEKKAISIIFAEPLEEIREIYQALVLGLRDYVFKNGFKKVVVGLSGGIDSALVLTLAVDALGKDNVNAVFMPSRFSSHESEIDANQLANNIGLKLLNIPIEDIYKIYLEILRPVFEGVKENITEENLQARIRGNILMALSNKFGWLVLTTGNKSEMSTGYATLYGDMAGGFAVIKDVFKTLVYKLARYRNSISPVIPERIIVKAPTAELKPNQKDSDTLPAYEVLDKILKYYIEEDKNWSKIISMGFNRETVTKVLTMVDKSEYKRRQSPPGIKITPKAFGRDRRMPITNGYKV
ncbi:MAG: NAD+ synthase [Candidatus Omnitrophota bacterium]